MHVQASRNIWPLAHHPASTHTTPRAASSASTPSPRIPTPPPHAAHIPAARRALDFPCRRVGWRLTRRSPTEARAPRLAQSLVGSSGQTGGPGSARHSLFWPSYCLYRAGRWVGVAVQARSIGKLCRVGSIGACLARRAKCGLFSLSG